MVAIPGTAIEPEQYRPINSAPLSKIGATFVNLAQLTALHDEAFETARLANLLGRAPYAAAALTLCAGPVVAHGGTSTAKLLIWIILMFGAVGAIAVSYGQAIGAPFERGTLRIFARHQRAIMLYAGFAWGVGAIIAVPADGGFATMLIYTAGMCALLTIIFRAWDVAACFAIPAGLLSAAAVISHPSKGGLVSAASMVAACAAMAGLAWLAGKASKIGRIPRLVPQN